MSVFPDVVRVSTREELKARSSGVSDSVSLAEVVHCNNQTVRQVR